MSKQEAKLEDRCENESDNHLSALDWSFPDTEPTEGIHGIHPYPAQMIPEIPDRLLSYFLQRGDISEGDWVYDPFGGSGTTAVESRKYGLNARLVDVNPLACMIARLKGSPPNPKDVKSAKKTLYSRENANNLGTELQNISSSREEYKIDLGSNYEWFPEPQLSQLGFLKKEVEKLSKKYPEEIIRFFRVALSETSRKVSYQRNGEFKRYRMPESKREAFSPDVWQEFKEIVSRNYSKVAEFYEDTDSTIHTEVYQTDARKPDGVSENSADLVLSSPPYGDHDTTVAYGQFSTDPAIIAKGEDPDVMRQVDDKGLGGASASGELTSELLSKSETLNSTYEILSEKEGRAEDALDFFTDYYSALKQTGRVLKPDQPMVLVVANRTMSRVNIPTHQITVEFCEKLNFEVEHILPRTIPRKTLPFENNPGGVSEEKGEMMAEEHILVFRNGKEKRP